MTVGYYYNQRINIIKLVILPTHKAMSISMVK